MKDIAEYLSRELSTARFPSTLHHDGEHSVITVGGPNGYASFELYGNDIVGTIMADGMYHVWDVMPTMRDASAAVDKVKHLLE